VTGTVSRYVHTLRHLKPEQVLFQLYYRFRRAVKPVSYGDVVRAAHAGAAGGLSLAESIAKPCSFRDGQYTFLNLSLTFPDDAVDWECMEYGKLWLYNLHYFDYLLQPDMTKVQGLELIRRYVDALPGMRVGIEPYPVSLRGINWIKFLSLHGIRDEAVDRSLYSQYHILSRSFEYHLLGNHLLENAFSLLFGAVYFGEQSWFAKSRKLLVRELEEQVLGDGAHFELSPMYHQILLDRLLDCVNLLQHNQRFAGQDALLSMLQSKAAVMLGWLRQMTFPDGSIPHVNDATAEIAPSTEELFSYAERLGIGSADTLNFVLQVHGKPFLVDTGISTYEKNSLRDEERGTAAHNTVVVNGMNSSDVWGGFRVGKRARVKLKEEIGNTIVAEHNGYKHLGVVHRRSWEFGENRIWIKDKLLGSTHKATAVFHFHHSLNPVLSDSAVVCKGSRFSFKGASSLHLESYRQALGFNKRVNAWCVVVAFSETLETEIFIS